MLHKYVHLPLSSPKQAVGKPDVFPDLQRIPIFLLKNAHAIFFFLTFKRLWLYFTHQVISELR